MPEVRKAGSPGQEEGELALFVLANVALRLGRSVRFDPQRETVVGDEEARRLLEPSYRELWTLG